MKLTFLTLALILNSLVALSQHPFINKYLEKGPYEAGFTRIWDFDRSRIWPRSAHLDSTGGYVNRPVRIDVWYPAAIKGTDNRMLYRDYVYPDTVSKDYEDMLFLLRRWDVYSYRQLAGDSLKFEALMHYKTSVYRDAKPVDGRYPLVVYSAGWYNRSPDNTILAEYLASHGYVVATVPQLNPGLWNWKFASDFRSVENQTRDLEFAVGKLIEQPYVDRTNIAAMGYSTGGDVALLLQGRNELIDCVIGMDASWSIAEDNDVADSPFFDPDNNNVPVLVLRRVPEGGGKYDRVLDRIVHARRYVVDLDGAVHGSFSDDPAQRELLGIKPEADSEIQAKISEAILMFLDSTLRDSQVSLKDQIEEIGLQVRIKAAMK